jgi:decaprenylphospho-beta-D-ribofuranose 2-oxidase
MPHSANVKVLNSYTRTASKECKVYCPSTIDQLHDIVGQLVNQSEPFCMMGGGNSFGDVFIPRHSNVIDCSGLNTITSFDSKNGRIVVPCGMQSGPLSAMLLKNGRYLTGSAGSLTNTIAGDISSNVNGKDSWKYGNFSSNVVSFELLTPNGEIVRVDREHPELFWGVMGGLGMLGIITSVEVDSTLAPSNHLMVDRLVTTNLDETIRAFNSLHEDEWDFAYAWVDVLGATPTIGRAVVERARFDTTKNDDSITNSFKPKSRIFGLKDNHFWNLYRGVQSALRVTNSDRKIAEFVNAFHYHTVRMQRKQNGGIPITTYQYPMLKALPNWNKGISNHGMQEVQMLFSEIHFSTAFFEVHALLKRYNIYPLICAIRKHKPDNGLLSFSGNGLSFTINYDRISFPNPGACFRMERELMAMVIQFEGKVYLSKFPYVNSDECMAMYAGVNDMKRLKNNLDPKNLLASNTSSRILGFG